MLVDVGELTTCRTGFADDQDDERMALEALAALSSPLKRSSLNPHEARLLAASEQGLVGRGDEANVIFAWALTGDDEEAAAYLRWLRILTARMAWSPTFIEGVERLVPHLLDHEVLSGRQVNEILEGEPDDSPSTHEVVSARS